MKGEAVVNKDKKLFGMDFEEWILAGSAIGVLISFVMALNGKRKKLAVFTFLISFAGMIYGGMRRFGILGREEEELLTLEPDGENADEEADA